MPRWYYVFILSAFKWISVASLLVLGLIAMCILVDWFGQVGWGYQWHDALAVGAIAAVAILIYRAAASLLRSSTENQNGPIPKIKMDHSP
jgi:hypothetical protein